MTAIEDAEAAANDLRDVNCEDRADMIGAIDRAETALRALIAKYERLTADLALYQDHAGLTFPRPLEGVEYEYGDAVLEADGTVWDHEPCDAAPWTAEEMAEKNREHIADMGKKDDGSRIVQVRRVTLGPWQLIEDAEVPS
jgi:hypothetical protein